MSLTEPQRRAALEMRANRMSTFDICMTLGLPRQDVTRLFMTEDCRSQDRSMTSKVRHNDVGYADEHMENLRETEARKAAELWFGRLQGARWDVKRRPDQG